MLFYGILALVMLAVPTLVIVAMVAKLTGPGQLITRLPLRHRRFQ